MGSTTLISAFFDYRETLTNVGGWPYSKVAFKFDGCRRNVSKHAHNIPIPCGPLDNIAGFHGADLSGNYHVIIAMHGGDLLNLNAHANQPESRNHPSSSA